MSTFRAQRHEAAVPLIITLAEAATQQASASGKLRIQHVPSGDIFELVTQVSNTPLGTNPETYQIKLLHDWTGGDWNTLPSGVFKLWSLVSFGGEDTIVPWSGYDTLIIQDVPVTT